MPKRQSDSEMRSVPRSHHGWRKSSSRKRRTSGNSPRRRNIRLMRNGYKRFWLQREKLKPFQRMVMKRKRKRKTKRTYPKMVKRSKTNLRMILCQTALLIILSKF